MKSLKPSLGDGDGEDGVRSSTGSLLLPIESETGCAAARMRKPAGRLDNFSHSPIAADLSPSSSPSGTGKPVTDRVPLVAGRCLRSLAGCAIHRCAALRNGPKDARIMFMHSVLPVAAAWHWHLFLHTRFGHRW